MAGKISYLSDGPHDPAGLAPAALDPKADRIMSCAWRVARRRSPTANEIEYVIRPRSEASHVLQDVRRDQERPALVGLAGRARAGIACVLDLPEALSL